VALQCCCASATVIVSGEEEEELPPTTCSSPERKEYPGTDATACERALALFTRISQVRFSFGTAERHEGVCVQHAPAGIGASKRAGVLLAATEHTIIPCKNTLMPLHKERVHTHREHRARRRKQVEIVHVLQVMTAKV
jgi:hypothetical protein